MLGDSLSNLGFQLVHGRNLVYNTCWEDPRVDRQALNLTSDDNVLVITSAGCNALDYAIAGAGNVYAVDMNHRQNALLELKQAAIRALEHHEFYALFGRGALPDFYRIYRRKLRTQLSESAVRYWDRNGDFFDTNSRGGSFYFRGTSGAFAWGVNNYLSLRPKLRGGIDALLAARSVEEQQDIYFGGLREAFWNRYLRWFMGRDMTLSMLGVPRRQRETLESTYQGGIVTFIEHCLDSVFGRLPLRDNYFWRVYLTGAYTRECCPEYLREENFEALKSGLVDNIHVHTASVRQFLEGHDGDISRFVLLDHMDWLHRDPAGELTNEWNAILAHATPDARVIWRSGGTETPFVDELRVTAGNTSTRLGELLHYNRDLAETLHQQDRVHTYGSFYIANLAQA